MTARHETDGSVVLKRENLARAMAGGGLLGLLESLSRKPCLVVLNYHRIGTPEKNRFDDNVFSATAEQFEAQLLWLKSRFTAAQPRELPELAEHGFALERPLFLVTFDDGYRDNFELALPILKRHQVPGVFFVPTSRLEKPEAPWWDFAAYVVKETAEPVLWLEESLGLRLDLEEMGKLEGVRQLLRAIKQARQLDYPRFLTELARAGCIDRTPLDLGQELFMNPEMVTEMVAAGMTIGGHTHSHRILAQLSANEQTKELERSRAALAEMTGQPVELLAYPVGGRGTFTEMTKRLAAEAGYTVGFSYYGGLCKLGHKDRFDVPRESVDSGTNFALTRARVDLQRWFGWRL